MRRPIGKRILIYLFLFVIVCSINNTALTSIKLESVKEIKIVGLGKDENLNLLDAIENLNLKNIFFLKKEEISKIIDSNSLVENYEIFKKYPSTLNIKIRKTEFLARINIDGKISLIGSNGKLSETKFSDNDLPFIFGKPMISEFLKLKNIIDQSSFPIQDIRNLYFFPSKRWDIELKDNIILKLPKNNILLALNYAFKILNDTNFKDIRVVDTRIKNQIILND